jgi:hypothetical protein
VAVASSLTIEKLRLRPELIDEKMQVDTQKTRLVLRELCPLLS